MLVNDDMIPREVESFLCVIFLTKRKNIIGYSG
jgi:hypothetical protein